MHSGKVQEKREWYGTGWSAWCHTLENTSLRSDWCIGKYILHMFSRAGCPPFFIWKMASLGSYVPLMLWEDLRKFEWVMGLSLAPISRDPKLCLERLVTCDWQVSPLSCCCHCFCGRRVEMHGAHRVEGRFSDAPGFVSGLSLFP